MQASSSRNIVGSLFHSVTRRNSGGRIEILEIAQEIIGTKIFIEVWAGNKIVVERSIRTAVAQKKVERQSGWE
jgi:hypothetical protein